MIICNAHEMLLLRGDFICEKGFGSNYRMKISLIENMHVGLIIIKVGESIKEVIVGRLDEN